MGKGLYVLDSKHFTALLQQKPNFGSYFLFLYCNKIRTSGCLKGVRSFLNLLEVFLFWRLTAFSAFFPLSFTFFIEMP
jgi:hypothetical protein